MKRDQLDEAIDITAARMTAVEEDVALAARIAAALPERSIWWPLAWKGRVAFGALTTLALVFVLRGFYDGSAIVLRTEKAPVVSEPATVEPPSYDRRTLVEPSSNDRRTLVEPSSNARRTTGDAERPDHERSLAPIAAPPALSLDSLAPSELAAEPALTLEPLAIADLPLTAEFSQR